jgi:hypothetical protein
MTSSIKASLSVTGVSTLGFAAWEYRRISTFLASPDPSDVYDKTWGFQLIASGIFHLPIFILIVAGALFASALMGRSKKIKAS